MAPEQLVTIASQEAREELVSKSVTETTLNQYRGRIAHLESWMARQGLAYLDLDQYARYIQAMAPSYVTLEGHRSALVWAQKARRLGLREGEPMWADSEEAKTLVKGADYNSGQPKEVQVKPRGAITEFMADQALAYLASNGLLFLVDPLTVLMFAAPRVGELEIACMEDWDKERQVLTVRKEKRRNADTMHKTEIGYQKPIVSPRAINSLDRHCTGRQGLMFPFGSFKDRRFNAKEMNALLKKIAAYFKWDPNLDFVVHSFRHGGAQHIQHVLEAQPSTTGLHDALHMHPSTASGVYLRPNQERIKKEGAHEELEKPRLPKQPRLDMWAKKIDNL